MGNFSPPDGGSVEAATARRCYVKVAFGPHCAQKWMLRANADLGGDIGLFIFESQHVKEAPYAISSLGLRVKIWTPSTPLISGLKKAFGPLRSTPRIAVAAQTKCEVKWAPK